MLIAVQKVLIEALASDTPLETLRAAVDRNASNLSAQDRDVLSSIDPDGFLLTSLLVRKLRFESVTRGDPEMERRFDRDPAAFVEAFRRYASEVPRHFFFPEDDARSFRDHRP